MKKANILNKTRPAPDWLKINTDDKIRGPGHCMSVMYSDLIKVLDWSLMPGETERDLLEIQEHMKVIWESTSKKIAVGVINSLYPNYIESLRARDFRAATPEAIIRFMIKPRLVKLGAFEAMVTSLFQVGCSSDSCDIRKPLLFFKISTGLAQEFFYNRCQQSEFIRVMETLSGQFSSMQSKPEEVHAKLKSIFHLKGKPGVLLKNLKKKSSNLPGGDDSAPVGPPKRVADVQGGRGGKRKRNVQEGS